MKTIIYIKYSREGGVKKNKISLTFSMKNSKQTPMDNQPALTQILTLDNSEQHKRWNLMILFKDETLFFLLLSIS